MLRIFIGRSRKVESRKVLVLVVVSSIVCLGILFNLLGYFYSNFWFLYDAVVFVAGVVFGVVKFRQYRAGQGDVEGDVKVDGKDALKEGLPVLRAQLLEDYADHVDKVVSHSVENFGDASKGVSPILTIVFNRYHVDGVHYFLMNLTKKERTSILGFDSADADDISNSSFIEDLVKEKKVALAENPLQETVIDEGYDSFGKPRRIIKTSVKKAENPKESAGQDIVDEGDSVEGKKGE